MTQEVLERAIKINDSIKCIDRATEFTSKHEKVFLELRAGIDGNSFFIGFTKEIKEFLIYEALPMYRARIADELDKLKQQIHDTILSISQRREQTEMSFPSPLQ